MAERVIVVLILFVALIMSDLKEFSRMDRKSAAVYILLMIPASYLALLFVISLPWPNLGDLLRAVYGWPADRITAFLKASP